jgi:uncharacterized protein (TIGR03086 family)
VTGPALAALRGGIVLLERAVDYALGSLDAAAAADLTSPTPCAGWDLGALLDHVNDSLLALHEAAAVGRVFPDPGDHPAPDPVALLRDRATRLVGAWAAPVPRKEIALGDLELTSAVVTATGAFEVAVHGWDVARACGAGRPIPAALAEELLALSPLLVTEADRPARFAAPVAVPFGAAPGDRLVALLGRHP